MSAPPPPPPLEASTAAALVAGLRAEGAELAQPAPSLFHVNNKYSHRRPRLACARRLQILRPRPFTRRGAESRGRGRARDRQSLRANQSLRKAERGTPRGGSPWISDFGVSVLPGCGQGEGHSAGGFPSALHQPSAMRGPEMSIVLILKITASAPPPTKKGRTQRLRGCGEGRKKCGRL